MSTQKTKWTNAFSAPAPVSERTSISMYFASLCSFEVTVPSQPRKNPSGMETSPGLASGNQWKSIDGSVIIEAALPAVTLPPDTVGLKIIRTMELMRPP